MWAKTDGGGNSMSAGRGSEDQGSMIELNLLTTTMSDPSASTR